MTVAAEILLVAVGVVMAGFFSGAETGIYRISRFKLRLGVEKKITSYKLLAKALKDSHSLVLSMLAGTNLAQYMVTTVVTAMFFRTAGTEHIAELYATAVMTPVLFVFSELIPKNLFIYHCDRLMPKLSRLIWLSEKFFAFTAITPLLKFIANVFAKLSKNPPYAQPAIVATQRHQISQIAADTIEEGILTPAQSKIIHRLMGVPQIAVKNVMTPAEKICSINCSCSKEQFIQKISNCNFTRLGVYENSKENITGYVNAYDILYENNFQSIEKFVMPIIKINQDDSVAKALGQMQDAKQKIAAVVAAENKIIGIVTIKDLVEEFIGEITNI